ncbi:hypothetical protein VE25_04615 [Devosia geojensis]|uniref:Uncharacterized protein n=1 Tax=Devosia geojensis TaxID=443610 RepID=A0A0F5FXL5_9HYPH|nr:hypothetical protein [Devosia geojensis]KKB12932.1 hypothetical protein VE25_04615 [Devosia geojensis]
MQQDGHDDKAVVGNTHLHAPNLDDRKTIWSRWPWGVTALAVIVAGWAGVYLLWNGIVFLFTL